MIIILIVLICLIALILICYLIYKKYIKKPNVNAMLDRIIEEAENDLPAPIN